MERRPGKYARFELERRFLLRDVPAGVSEDDGWQITDRYLVGTRLRLRKMVPLDGGEAIYKLGRKDVPAPPDYSRVILTNIYLSPAEYAVFERACANEVRKVRYGLDHGDAETTIDVFQGVWEGLVLAEIGFPTAEEMTKATAPSFAVREVSSDIRFTGGALAAATSEEASLLLASARDQRMP